MKHFSTRIKCSVIIPVLFWSSHSLAQNNIMWASPNPCVANPTSGLCTTTVVIGANPSPGGSIGTYVQQDGSSNPWTLFTCNLSPGTFQKDASWINIGHSYVFASFAFPNQGCPYSPTGSTMVSQTPVVTAVTPMNYTNFANQEDINIIGYNGPEQDPFVSPDGQYLFFDDHSDTPGTFSHIHWATRIDYKTFQYRGKVIGQTYQVNIEGKNSLNASIDLAGNFYYMTNDEYAVTGKSARRGNFSVINGFGTVANVTNVVGIQGSPATYLTTIGHEINSDGTTIYYANFQTNGTVVTSSKIVVASRNIDGSFTTWADSSAILQNINNTGPVLYNAMVSLDGLEMVFTSSESYQPDINDKLKIFLAKRNSTLQAFGTPVRVTAVGGLAENGSFSPDRRHLYFHYLNPLQPEKPFIKVVTRNPAP